MEHLTSKEETEGQKRLRESPLTLTLLKYRERPQAQSLPSMPIIHDYRCWHVAASRGELVQDICTCDIIAKLHPKTLDVIGSSTYY